MQGNAEELNWEVIAAQFAGGMSVVELMQEWERPAAWVEAAIRRAMLEYIPARSGGLKPSRAQVQAQRREEDAQIMDLQPALPMAVVGAVGAVAGVARAVRKVIGYGENGYRVGESHHNARISDATVDRIREMREDEHRPMQEIAQEFGLPVRTVEKICYYECRATTPVKFVRLKT